MAWGKAKTEDAFDAMIANLANEGNQAAIDAVTAARLRQAAQARRQGGGNWVNTASEFDDLMASIEELERKLRS